MTAPCHAKKQILGFYYSNWKYIDSIDPKHRTMRDEWCNQSETRPVKPFKFNAEQSYAKQAFATY